MSGAFLQVNADVSQVKALVSRLRAAMSDLTPFYRNVGEIITQGVQRAFDSEANPDTGLPWIKSKKKSGKTLTDTAVLRNSVHWRASRESATVGTNVIYAAIHQFGGKTKAHDIRPKSGKTLAFQSGGKMVFARSVKHPGSNIPARPYLGVDREAWAEIIDTGERFLERATR